MRDSRTTKRDLTLLSAYLDGQLAAQDVERLETRLASDPYLKTTLEELKATQRLLARVPEIRVPRQFTLTPATAGLKEPGRGYPGLRFATVAVAIAFAAVLGLDFLLGQASLGGMESEALMLRTAQQVEPAVEAPAEALAEVEAAEVSQTEGEIAGVGEAQQEQAPVEEPMMEAAPAAVEEETLIEAEEAKANGTEEDRMEAPLATQHDELAAGGNDQTFADAADGIAATPGLEEIEELLIEPEPPPGREWRAAQLPRGLAFRILEIGLGGLAVILLILTLEARRRP